jgi:ribA/ribD-fused uncharacterized protein
MVSATDARSVGDLTRAVVGGAKPRFVFFWGHRAQRSGELDHACFSQWWAAPFEVDGRRFGTAEHYMMWRKATLFDDRVRAAEVLTARSPAHAKALGREVRGFREEVWVDHRWDIVVEGSVAKFASTPELRTYLLATRNRVLAEASPADRIWGIGLTADSEFAARPQRWRGLNLLGFALMEARARLGRA